VLVVNQQVGAKDAKELIAMMAAKPDTFSYASSGVGSTQHLAGEGFKLATGVKMTHVPYKGSSQAHLDLIAGSVQVMFDTTSSAMSQIKAGKLKALAVTTPKRAAELPDVPTLAEAGIAGFEMSTWYGLFVTTGTPKDVIARLVDETNKILRLPDVQAKLRSLGGEPGGMSVEQFAALNKSEFDRFGKLIREANVKID
jgi:tripartite-type tricarboxylate transporter receptor subunit TctC